MDFVEIIKLYPLCKALRDRIFGRQESLDESIKSMSIVSELIVKKLSFLLPSQKPPSPEEDAEFDINDEEDPEYLVAVSLWQENDFERACQNIRLLLSAGALRFDRGCPRLGVSKLVPVMGIAPMELRDAYLALKNKRGDAAKTVVVPKWNFLAHLRRFWREIRSLASKGRALKLSDFFGKGKSDYIMNFLALLELVKRNRVFARQDDTFGEIVFSPNLKSSAGNVVDKPLVQRGDSVWTREDK